jgi:hypothetical protein
MPYANHKLSTKTIRYNNPHHYILIAIVLDLPSDLELAGGGKLDNPASPENALAREAQRVNLNLEAAQGEHQARRRLSDSSDGSAA